MLDKLQEIEYDYQKLADRGNLEYPIVFYYLNLKETYLGYIRWHWHTEVEITYVTKGMLEYSIGEETLLVKEGEAIFVNQNTLHTIHPVEGQASNAYSMLFHPTFLFGYTQTLMMVKYLIPLLSAGNFKHCKIENSPINKMLLADIQAVFSLNQKKEFGYELLSKSHMCQIWFALLERAKLATDDTKKEPEITLDEVRVKKVLSFIQSHHAEALTLDDIADSVHISRSECCRCFKRALKLTPFEYLMKYRIYQSAKAIASSASNTMSISDLAASVGFNNTSYFNKLFKKYLHCTPGEYRKQVKENQKTNASSFGPLFDP